MSFISTLHFTPEKSGKYTVRVMTSDQFIETDSCRWDAEKREWLMPTTRYISVISYKTDSWQP